MSPPYTPLALAERWSCSSETVRQLCKTGKIKSFRVGKQFRIPAQAVEEYEQCMNTASVDFTVASSSLGVRKMDAGAGIVLKHTPSKPRRQKHAISSSHRQQERVN